MADTRGPLSSQHIQRIFGRNSPLPRDISVHSALERDTRHASSGKPHEEPSWTAGWGVAVTEHPFASSYTGGLRRRVLGTR